MEAKINNSEEQRRIRKSGSTLVIVGTGIMIFGVWAALKSFSLLLLRERQTIQELRGYAPEDAPYINDKVLLTATIVGVTVYVLIELAVRAFVGFSAIAEGRGKKSGSMYIVFTFILILLTLSSVITEVYVLIIGAAGGFKEALNGVEHTTELDVLTSLVIDLTSMVLMVQMVVSAFRLKKYKKQQGLKEADHAA